VIALGGTNQIGIVQQQLTRVAEGIHTALEGEIRDIMDDLLRQTPEVTPWRVKPKSRAQDPHMQDVYFSQVNGLSGTFLNQRFYSGWVARTGTRRMRPNARLKGWLEQYDDEAGAMLDAAVSRKLAEFGL
jgi:hypothetical protein